jgi:hypothetical protein
MPLPRGDEYNLAVQNPAINFYDRELKTCKVETTHLGLPKPYSGGFTTTYKLISKMDNWAVRCFTRDISDLRQRYKAIGNFQNKNLCEFLVEAKYLRQGIRISNDYYSVIKMKWQEGYALNAYIDTVYKQRKKLEIILNEFTNLIERLTKLEIAHGDLQHGNILVENNKIYLIDYDGMFLPELSDLYVSELGHPNFQHPRRTINDFNKHIDRFSSIIIYTALKALIISPRLWNRYDNGDNLLFKAEDFINPQKSKLLNELIQFPDLRKLIKNLINICSSEFKEIPSLPDFLNTSIKSSKQILPEITTVRNAYKVLDGTNLEHLLDHVGEKVEVIGKIDGSVEGSTRFGPYIFLTMGEEEDQTFTIVIWYEGILSLGSRGIKVSTLTNKWISITGVLSVFLSKPQMILDNVLQINIFDNEKEAKKILNNSPMEDMYHSIQIAPKAHKINEEDISNYVQEHSQDKSLFIPIPEINISKIEKIDDLTDQNQKEKIIEEEKRNSAIKQIAESEIHYLSKLMNFVNGMKK